MIRLQHDPSILIFLVFVLLSVHPSHVEPSHDAPEKGSEAELLALHQADRRAHFKHDIPALLEHVGPQLLDIRDGRITRLSRQEVRARFTEYFQDAQFSAWEDLEPPVVRVSEDGRLAWMAVRVRITFTQTNPNGKKILSDSVMAWMSAYERQGKNWIMTAVTSTSEPAASR
jgi:hypothetical protein